MNNPLTKMMGNGGGANPMAGGFPNMNMNAINQVKNMMNMFRGAANPQQLIMQMAQQNPQVASILQMCNGKNPKDVFYEQCKTHNVNPDQVLGMLGMNGNETETKNTGVPNNPIAGK